MPSGRKRKTPSTPAKPDEFVSICSQQRGERALAPRDREVDDTNDLGLRQEAQQIGATRRNVGVCRKRDDGHSARTCDVGDRADRLCEQRVDDNLRSFGDGLLCGPLRRLRIARVVFDQELHVWLPELGECQIGRVLHRLRGKPGITLRRERQNECGSDLAVKAEGMLRQIAEAALWS